MRHSVPEPPHAPVYNPRRLHIAQFLLEHLEKSGLEVYDCPTCLTLHLRPVGAQIVSPSADAPDVSAQAVDALRMLRREIQYVLASRRARV